MKTSFYFVLWIGIFLLIDIIGNSWIQSNAFFIALVAVWILTGIINKLTEKQRDYIIKREFAAFFEIVYSNDYCRFLKILRNRFLFATGTVIYFLIAIVFLFMIRENLIITAIFGLFGFYSVKHLCETYKAYSEARNAGRIELNQEIYDLYLSYKEGRDAGYNADRMYPPATWKDKLLRGCNFTFAIMSIILGMIYIGLFIPGLFMHGDTFMGAAMLIAYGGLAFIYGINDLATSITGYNTNIK